MYIKYFNAFKDINNKQYLKEKYRLQVELLKLQEWILKNKLKVAVVFEGRDAAGKGSAIKRIVEHLMTAHFRVVAIGTPTKKQNNSWFYTYEKTLPKKGEIVFYDRSWYSRSMIQPTMGYCSYNQYNYFMRKVCDWEKKQIKNGLLLIKIYLSINKPTQQKRFYIRKNHSLKYWKLSPNDLLSVSSWDRYTYFKEKTFEKTSYKAAPWIVINANNKMTARLNALRYLLETVDYENKKILKPKSWTFNENNRSIMLQDVMFNDLNESQYQLLNEIKQIL